MDTRQLSALRLLRRTGIIEGISFLVLLFGAMPLKYLADLPIAVKVVGWIHGLLFIAFVWALFRVWRVLGWSVPKCVGAMIASLLPFGTFIADRGWKRDEEALRAGR